MAPSSAATPTHGYEPTREAAMAIASTLAAAGYNFILLLRWRNTLSSGMLTTRFLFPKFFPKKIWPKNWGGSSNRKFREWFVRGSGPAPPRPPFRADEKHPGSFPRGGFPGAAFGARDRSLGRSIGGWLPVSCQRLPHSCHI